jgi:hypothetical protein
VSEVVKGAVGGPDVIEYGEELVMLADVIKDPTLQVRAKVDSRTVSKYADEMKFEQVFPMIKLGRIDGQLLLIDGWHRMAAMQLNGATEEWALVATMTRRQAQWEAAKPNLTHGLPLKASEKRPVFKAYVRSLQHRKKLPGMRSASRCKSYREMGAELGVGHTTLRGWMMADFPTIARELGGADGPNKGAGTPSLENAQAAYERQVKSALVDAANVGKLIKSPETRFELVEALEAVIAELRKEPLLAPQF